MKSKKFLSKSKRIVVSAMAAVCALSSVAALCANAASETYTHTVSVTSNAGSDDATWMVMSYSGTCSDTFPSYPTIYNNYSNSYNMSRVEDEACRSISGNKYFTLQKNSSSTVTVSYGQISRGERRLYYRHESGGGFSSSVTTTKRY